MAEIKATHPEARDLEVWFLDEAGVGQTAAPAGAGSRRASGRVAAATCAMRPSTSSARSAPSATTAWPWSCPR